MIVRAHHYSVEAPPVTLDGDESRKTSPLEGPELVGEYRDRFVRTSQGWRMQERRIRVSFLRGPE